LNGISKAYGQSQALQPTDLKIQLNRITELIGPSGCGKSTILQLMGKVRIDEWQDEPEELVFEACQKWFDCFQILLLCWEL